MKRIVLSVGLIAILGGGGLYAYSKLGGSPEAKRDRALKKAQEYLAQAKVNEAVIEYKNALSADPRSAEAHYEFGMALLKQGDGWAGYRELVRATDLKPDFIKARYQVALIHAVNKDIKRANEELEKIRQQDKDAKEAHYLAAQIAMAEKQPDSALKELEAALTKTLIRLRFTSISARCMRPKKISLPPRRRFAKRWRSTPSFTARE